MSTKTKKLPTPGQVEKKIGPANGWAGNCYAIATQCVEEGLVSGRAVYGHWLGPVMSDSYFGKKGYCDRPFVRHGWVVLDDGRIFDPTRWGFTGEDPFLWVGPGDDKDYDEGGNGWRVTLMKACPEFDTQEKSYYAFPEHLPTAAWNHVEKMIGEAAGEEPGWITKPQLHWLANAPYQSLDGHERAIYGFLKKIGFHVYVPIDNWRRAFPEETDNRTTTNKTKKRKK
jgi:hypothetical protein